MAFSPVAGSAVRPHSSATVPVTAGYGAGFEDGERARRFVDAARTLAEETGAASFTVHQVIERAGLSRKSFYRCFDGRDDLLLALLADDSAVGALLLAQTMGAVRSPRRRVHAWVIGLFDLMAAGEQGYVAVLIREHRRLTETRPEQTEAAVAPFIDLLAEALVRATSAGLTRPGDPRRDASTIFDLVLLKIHDLVVGRSELGPAAMAEYVSAFCWDGLRVGAAPHVASNPGSIR